MMKPPRWSAQKLNSLLRTSTLISLFSNFRTFASSISTLHHNYPTSISVLSHVETSRVFSYCRKQGNLRLGSSLHASIIKNYESYNPRNYATVQHVIVVWNSLLSMYTKCGTLQDALKVFYEMPLRDTVSWNSVISGYLSNGEFDMGFLVFKEMLELGIGQIDQATLTTVLSACDGSGFLGPSDMIHALVILSGYERETTIGNALITSYFNCGCPDCAKQILNEMDERNVITWTAAITGLLQCQCYGESLKLFSKMRSTLVNPNSLTCLSLLSACSGLGALIEGKQIHGLVWKLGVHSDLCIESALMDMYSKSGSMEDALLIFYSADDLDEVSMTVVLVGLAQNGMEQEAIQMFLKMMRSGIDIDSNMVSAILGIFGVDTTLIFGQQMHSLIIKKGFSSNPYVSNGLINIYSKCGNLDESIKIFHCMPIRNSVSWNSIIAAFARHGDGSKALDLYDEMILDNQVKPTDVTFLSLLHACSHAGFIVEGMEFLESMTNIHGISPRMEHYACVVDMLGRAGLLNEAKIFVEELPVKPGILVWQALIGACSFCGDSNMGTYAAEQLFLAAPGSAAPYILLANIYSSEGRWREKARTIKRMKEMGVGNKETGISWIEIEKKVHSFVVWDKVHPQAEMIHVLLMELYRQMNDEGYMPDKRYIYRYEDEKNVNTRYTAAASESLAACN